MRCVGSGEEFSKTTFKKNVYTFLGDTLHKESFEWITNLLNILSLQTAQSFYNRGIGKRYIVSVDSLDSSFWIFWKSFRSSSFSFWVPLKMFFFIVKIMAYDYDLILFVLGMSYSSNTLILIFGYVVFFPKWTTPCPLPPS